MTFGERLKEALIAAKKSRKELAHVLKIKVQAIGMVITGGGKEERRLSVENTKTAAKFLHVNYEWLSTGNGPQSASQPVMPPIIQSVSAPLINAASRPLSEDAIGLATAFDWLVNDLDRTQVKQIAEAEIFARMAKHAASLLKQHVDQPSALTTPAPSPAATPKKPRAQSQSLQAPSNKR